MPYFASKNIINEAIVRIEQELVVFNEELKLITNNNAWVDFENNEFKFRHYSMNYMTTGHNPNNHYDVVGKYECSNFYFNNNGGQIATSLVFVAMPDINTLLKRIADSLPVRTYLAQLKGNV